MPGYQRGYELIAAMQPDAGNGLLGDLDDLAVNAWTNDQDMCNGCVRYNTSSEANLALESTAIEAHAATPTTGAATLSGCERKSWYGDAMKCTSLDRMTLVWSPMCLASSTTCTLC